MRQPGAEKETKNQHDQRRNQHSRYRCGTGRARRAGEGPLEETGQPEKGRAQGPESRQGRKSQGRAEERGQGGQEIRQQANTGRSLASPRQHGSRAIRREDADPNSTRHQAAALSSTQLSVS